jgi:hypothetical protein
MQVITNVIVPNKGRHFHLTEDCAGLWQGWLNSDKADRNVWATDLRTLEDAEDMGKFACRRCYQRAGIAIPAHLDRLKVTADKRAAKLAARQAVDLANLKAVLAAAVA